MKDVVKKKINLSKKTKLWLAIIISLIIVITFFCGFFTYKLFLGEKKNSINWAVSMIDKYGCYYDENTGEIKKYSEEEYINMITSSLDKYSKYFSKESYNGEIQTSKGNFYGVGFSYSLDENKKPYIVSVYWNSPAEKAGFNDNDKLISGTINGEKTVFDNEESFNTFLSRINDKEFELDGSPFKSGNLDNIDYINSFKAIENVFKMKNDIYSCCKYYNQIQIRNVSIRFHSLFPIMNFSLFVQQHLHLYHVNSTDAHNLQQKYKVLSNLYTYKTLYQAY